MMIQWMQGGHTGHPIRDIIHHFPHHAADHVPILTEFDLSLAPRAEVCRRQWREANWEGFLKALAAVPMPLNPLNTPDQADQAAEHLVRAILGATESTVPKARICRFSQSGYTKELAPLRAQVNRTRQWARTGDEADVEAYRRAVHQLERQSRKTATKAHRERVDEATQALDGFWKLARWARRRGEAQPTFTPTLVADDHEIDRPEEKAAVLREALFPPPPEADLADTLGYQHPDPIPMPPVTEEEVARAVKHAAPLKAPGPDGIPNAAIQRALPVVRPYLTHLFNACLSLDYCPKHFRESTTVVIRKPGKPDYTTPKAYRPIALLSTIGKALEAVIATRMSYLVEAYGLLPTNHVGGRRG
ncbi:hypothetical protein GB937_010884, partial [Aspergillus fischeri]